MDDRYFTVSDLTIARRELAIAMNRLGDYAATGKPLAGPLDDARCALRQAGRAIDALAAAYQPDTARPVEAPAEEAA
mgnify:CR=1 FL=1